VQEVDRPVNIWSLHAIRLPPGERNAALREEALNIMARPFRVLDEALGNRDFLLGREFTVADLNVAAVISRAIELDLTATPRLAHWLQACLSRPAAQEARRLRAEADATVPVEITREIAKRNRM
jgi:glutathione S-transferase